MKLECENKIQEKLNTCVIARTERYPLHILIEYVREEQFYLLG